MPGDITGRSYPVDHPVTDEEVFVLPGESCSLLPHAGYQVPKVIDGVGERWDPNDVVGLPVREKECVIILCLLIVGCSKSARIGDPAEPGDILPEKFEPLVDDLNIPAHDMKDPVYIEELSHQGEGDAHILPSPCYIQVNGITVVVFPLFPYQPDRLLHK